MELADLLTMLTRYVRSMVIVGLLVAGATLAGLMSQRPAYDSQSTVFFTVKSSGAAGDLQMALIYANSQAKNYGTLAQKGLG